MSETGHAKNVANFETVTIALTAVGADYDPPQPLIFLPALQTHLGESKSSLLLKSQTAAAKTLAVDNREAEYKDIGKYANNVGRAAAVNINDAAFNEDMKSITRLLNGKRAGDAPVDDPATPNVDESQAAHSVSHLSYDNIESNWGKMVTLVETKNTYKVNEPEFKLETLQAKHAALQTTNNAAKAAYIADDNALEQRDEKLYDDETGILKRVELIKTYIEYRFGKQSAIYKQINALKFKKVK